MFDGKITKDWQFFLKQGFSEGNKDDNFFYQLFVPARAVEVSDIVRQYVRPWAPDNFGSNLFLLLDHMDGTFSEEDFYQFDNQYVLRLMVLQEMPAPVAKLTFEFREKYVLTTQNQGLKHGKGTLKFIEWDRFLYDALFHLSEQLGLEKMQILRAENNKWFTHPVCLNGKMGDHQKRFRRRYNELPARMGFVLPEGSDSWERPTKQYF